MANLRLRFMLHLYDWSSKVYASTFKLNKKAWGISKDEFLAYPEGTLGRALGDFYLTKGFDVMPKLENHDVFHLLTQTNTEIEDEVAMQFLLLGNGKISLYLLGMISIGSLIYPEYLSYYIKSFKKGRAMQRFYDIEFKHQLNVPLALIQASYTNLELIINYKNI